MKIEVKEISGRLFGDPVLVTGYEDGILTYCNHAHTSEREIPSNLMGLSTLGNITTCITCGSYQDLNNEWQKPGYDIYSDDDNVWEHEG